MIVKYSNYQLYKQIVAIFRALPSGRAARKKEISIVDGPKPAPNPLPTVRPLSP